MAAPILRYFAHAHLPAPLSDVSAGFAALAHDVDEQLLEAKDAAVRAALDIRPNQD